MPMMTALAGHRPARAIRPAVAVLAFGAAVWFAANLDGTRGPRILGWVPGPLCLLLAAVAMRRVATTDGLPRAARRFWNRFGVVAALCATGMVIHAHSSLSSSGGGSTVGGDSLPTPGAVVIILALLSVVWALLRVPVGPRTTTAWVRLFLDGATVVLGAALFMWYVAFAPMLTADRSLGAVWAQVAIGAVCLTGLAAVVKIILAGSGPVDMDAMRMLAVGLLVGGVSAGAASIIPAEAQLEAGQLSSPIIAWLLVLAAERQRAAVDRPDPPARPAARPYSLLPYVAVAATDVLLVLATTGVDDGRRTVVVGGAIAITALVVSRQVVAFVDNARLVRQLRQREDELRHQASHDALTRLANRALFGERVDAALARPGAGGRLAVLLVDLDDFKTVNDTLGHSVGDELLAALAQRVAGSVRPGDSVARLGGDEFAVLLPDADPGSVEAVAERILAGLTRPVVVPECQLLIQASIGIAVAEPGDDTGTLLRKSDIAMYAAKERGKGGFAHYTPGMTAHILEHARLGAQLREALDGGQLHLVYQPIVRLADHRIVGVETLVRWRHPTRGAVSPVEFIPVAERTGLIVLLGRRVLREACRQFAAWRAAYGDAGPATVAVNVSGRQLQEPNFVDEVADAVHEAGLRPHDLVLEVTETAVFTGRQALDTLRSLHGLGVRLALDDFGTGQSSLGLIHTCPVDILKLDKSFVEAGDDGQQRSAVATAVAQIAQALGLEAVAEGIETQEQADRLAGLGYELGQGFHLVPPLPADRLDGMLSPTALPR